MAELKLFETSIKVQRWFAFSWKKCHQIRIT